jgi:PPOX class probable F420-dependent enzyme
MSHSQQADIDAIFASNYLSLCTRRKNGDRVATPVWFAGTPNAFYVFSAADAGKVKRLRNFSDVRVAPCSVSGKLRGEWLPATATLIGDVADSERAYTALLDKYGWQMRLIDLFSRLGGRYDQRQLIRIALDDGAAAAH